MIFLLDNYDSFTFNLYQYLAELGVEFYGKSDEIQVYRNDQISIREVKELQPDAIVISPGPGTPERAGIAVELVKEYAGTVPILGVCLGHQSVGVAFGGKICRARRLMHGKVSEISHDGRGVFSRLPDPFTGNRYHSLVLEEKSRPPELEVSARSEDGEIMGIRHREYLIEGVQFHPESILTEVGKTLLGNFLQLKKSKC